MSLRSGQASLSLGRRDAQNNLLTFTAMLALGDEPFK